VCFFLLSNNHWNFTQQPNSLTGTSKKKEKKTSIDLRSDYSDETMQVYKATSFFCTTGAAAQALIFCDILQNEINSTNIYIFIKNNTLKKIHTQFLCFTMMRKNQKRTTTMLTLFMVHEPHNQTNVFYGFYSNRYYVVEILFSQSVSSKQKYFEQT